MEDRECSYRSSLGDVVADFSWQLSGLDSSDDYLDCAGALLQLLVPAAGVSRGRLDTLDGSYTQVGWPAEAFALNRLSDRMVSAYVDHPMITTYFPHLDTANGRPRRTSDIVSLTDLRKTTAYAQILRPLGWLNQLTILTERNGMRSGTCWVFDRGPAEFSDNEVDIVRALQPLLNVYDRMAPTRAVHEEAVAVDHTVLTPREIEVLSYIARGLTARAASAYLRIAEGTVNKHLESAYRKLGVDNRVAAIEQAHRKGLLTH